MLEMSSTFIHWLQGHTRKEISIHQCLFFSDSKGAVTDEGDTIGGKTVKCVRKKKPGREEDEHGPLKRMTNLGHWIKMVEIRMRKVCFVRMTGV